MKSFAVEVIIKDGITSYFSKSDRLTDLIREGVRSARGKFVRKIRLIPEIKEEN